MSDQNTVAGSPTTEPGATPDGAPMAVPAAAEPPRPAITRKPPPTRWERVRRRLLIRSNRPVVSILVFLVAWHLIAIYIVDKPLFLSTPIDVAREIRDQHQAGTLWNDLKVSASEFLKGFTGGLFVGVVLGMILGTSRRFKAYADPIINASYATPLIALAPLFILWFGIGEQKTVLLVFLLVILPVAINTDVGIRATDPQHIEAARSFGANKLQLFTMVRLPTSISFVVAGIRMGIARGLIGVVVGEFFGSREGMGYRILLSSQFFNNAGVLSGVLIFAITGVFLVMLFERIERRVAPWKFSD